ncbi:DUF2726 domain-containing protein [Acinetobacter faecalis]|uniref:DUF2726 domain-containing protein n=1 Tax=Acinetobacter faecalis TaxID=2665161 RepID=UPI002A90EBD8|nr:DUF2726 domain-containing protein [Acinetobacter faecalis]MDY6456621.1 DUF2726 domain-containing protein [Acinetobacter faecalis]MDY6468559.1 DUF2726 domain-containing protein [Acinetobacter faecalis]
MVIYFLMGALLLALIVFLAVKNLRSGVKPHDSALKQRAIFNISEQLTFARLKQALPKYTVLAQVSFDSLLTTKFYHTRSKYRNMTADFVVLGQQNEVIAIIVLEDYHATKKHKDVVYQEKILKMAGYRVFHFDGVPNIEYIKDEFRVLDDSELFVQDIASKKYEFYTGTQPSYFKLMN